MEGEVKSVEASVVEVAVVSLTGLVLVKLVMGGVEGWPWSYRPPSLQDDSDE